VRYVALLRGINVGGKNLIKMPALKVCFDSLGFTEVATYIASGNVLFTAAGPGAALTSRIEAALGAAFGYRASVVLRTRKQLADIVAKAPAGFGRSPERYRYDVIFLKPPLTAATALRSLTPRPGVDTADAGPGALYVSRLIAKAAQSHLTKLIALPIYKSMTIRNWNTTTALLRLVES